LPAVALKLCAAVVKETGTFNVCALAELLATPLEVIVKVLLEVPMVKFPAVLGKLKPVTL
jgi:hypothetical protein